MCRGLLTGDSWIFLSHSFCTRSLTRENSAKSFIRGKRLQVSYHWITYGQINNAGYVFVIKFGRLWRCATKFWFRKRGWHRESYTTSCSVIHQIISLLNCRLIGPSKVIVVSSFFIISEYDLSVRLILLTRGPSFTIYEEQTWWLCFDAAVIALE